MSGRKTAGTVAVVVGLSLGLSPSAAADEYTDTDTEFIGGVSRGLNNVVVDKQMIDQLIAAFDPEKGALAVVPWLLPNSA